MDPEGIPNAGRRPAAGDHKGAQPPYQVEKQPQAVFQLVIPLSFFLFQGNPQVPTDRYPWVQ